MNENNEWKNEMNEQDLEQAAGGDATANHSMKFRFRCPNCANVRTFTDSIGSLVCDCGATMVPLDSFTT